jgi:hypothetical protein
MVEDRDDSFCIIDSVKMDLNTLSSFFDDDFRLVIFLNKFTF